MSLSESLQEPFKLAFEGMFKSATGPEQGEVDWLEHFHSEVGEKLDQKLRETMRNAEIWDSVIVQSAFIHGNPFQIEPVEPLSRRVEAGDLLLVGERYDGGGVIERQALLLQMKVGPPNLNRTSTLQQALLYGSWPPITWQSQPLRELPGPHPRTPTPGPCDAAQFGIIPAAGEAASPTAQRLIGPGIFTAESGPLSAEMAAVSRLESDCPATLATYPHQPSPLTATERSS